MRTGERVFWKSATGKQREGTFLFELAARPGWVVVLDDDGAQHTMRKNKPIQPPAQGK